MAWAAMRMRFATILMHRTSKRITRMAWNRHRAQTPIMAKLVTILDRSLLTDQHTEARPG